MRRKYLWYVFLTILCISCGKESADDSEPSNDSKPSVDYKSSIIGWWEWDMEESSGIRFMSNGSACFWDEYDTYDTFGWWIEGNVLCTREWAPGESGTPVDGLCSWAGNPKCNCNKEGGRHITKIIKLTDTEMILSVDDDRAHDSDYDMPSQIKFTKIKGVQ